MTEQLRAEGRTAERFSRLTVSAHGDGLLVQAGATPERGDVNRRIVPEAYREADAFLRPLRVRDGKRVITDGPYAETHEVIGGYYLILANSRDEALRVAARHPGARFGAVEVRPAATLTLN